MPNQETAEAEDYTEFRDKPATPLQAHFAEWITEQLEIDPQTAYKTKAAAFTDGVRLGTALRMQFQASPENRAATAERRAEREAARLAAKAEVKPRGRRAAAPEAEEPEPEQQEAPKPRRGRPAKAATASTAAF